MENKSTLQVKYQEILPSAAYKIKPLFGGLIWAVVLARKLEVELFPDVVFCASFFAHASVSLIV